MASNAQKTPLSRSLNLIATNRALDVIRTLGRALPCRVVSAAGSIVTVEFLVTGFGNIPRVTMPTAFPEYLRVPFQAGDAGMTVPADTYLGGVSGLGGGSAGAGLVANLSALIFVPVGSKNFSEEDPNVLLLYGPDGTVIGTKTRDAYVSARTGVVTLHAASIVFDGPVIFNSTVTGEGGVVNFGTAAIHAGNVTSNGVNVGSTHVHSGVMGGGSNSGPPV